MHFLYIWEQANTVAAIKAVKSQNIVSLETFLNGRLATKMRLFYISIVAIVYYSSFNKL